MTPRTLAEVDLTAIMTALAATESKDNSTGPKEDRRRQAELSARARSRKKARIDALNPTGRSAACRNKI
jgi:hypothetical protein